MVLAIHQSDSCNTLVSLDNHHDARSKPQPRSSTCSTSSSTSSCSGSCPSSSEFRKTQLLLPVDELDLSDSSSNSYGYCCCEEPQSSSLYLPAKAPVDDYLALLPAVRDSCDELLAARNQHHLFTEASPERIVYVHQGEVAHALASQCDVLVSDRATTCHILALQSRSSNNNNDNNKNARNKQAMTSLTHIDGDQYEASVRAMIQEHKEHHASATSIEMDIHILGGFVDEEGHSQKISNWLLHLLADIAAEEASSGLQMRLETCAISSLNDNGFQCPIGRGLAIHLATGRVFLAKASSKVVGPQISLRNARLWSAAGEEEGVAPASSLHVVHTTTSNAIIISPFSFQALPGMDQLMALPDDVLLEYTSTSPCVEEEDFCASVRATLRFLLEVPSSRVFGRFCDRTLRFGRRHPHSNEWMLLASS